MGPRESVVRATAISTEDSSPTSHTTGKAVPPTARMASATVWMLPGSRPGSSVRAATATEAPARARAVAMSRPMPRLAPATNATRLSSFGRTTPTLQLSLARAHPTPVRR